MNYFWPSIMAFIITLALTPVVKKIALGVGAVDYPAGPRKIHQKVIPLLGGAAVFLGFFLTVGYEFFFTSHLSGQLAGRQILALLVGSAILMFGGYLDDRYSLPAKYQIFFPILAALAIVAGGVTLTKITNPFGGTFALDFWQAGGRLVLVDVLVFLWLLGMMYTTKLLDGLDGLTTGLTAIGSLMIFFLANSQKFYQPEIAWLALIFCGANLGFLLFNFHPAKIFLGEGGSLMAGFILGVLAIVSGGKIATTLLVVGIPALDVLLVIVRRLWQGRPPWQSDASHLHHRLLGLGWSQRKTVLFFYALAAGFGILTLFLQSKQKMIALVVLGILFIIGSWWLLSKKRF